MNLFGMFIFNACNVYTFSDLHSTEIFRNSNGPQIVMDILNKGKQNMEILQGGFAVVAAAATANEVLKESFVEMNIDELILQTLSTHRGDCISSLYDAIRILLTPDDNRVVASQVRGLILFITVDVMDDYLTQFAPHPSKKEVLKPSNWSFH